MEVNIMKVGSFEDTELLIDTKNNMLLHKESGIHSTYEKCNDEKENLKRFAEALHSLEVRYGMYLIDNYI
jgi:hypothetical protein